MSFFELTGYGTGQDKNLHFQSNMSLEIIIWLCAFNKMRSDNCSPLSVVEAYFDDDGN